MKNMWYGVFICSITLLVGCSTPKISGTKLIPAQYHEAAALKQVAVMPFSGNEGRQFAPEIEAVLTSIRVNDKPFFSLVDRSKLDQVMSEMRLNLNGMINADTAAQIGNMVGAKGIYTGEVSTSVSDTGFQEERSECASYTTKKDKKGNTWQVCERNRTYHVNCTKREAKFEFTPKLIEVETARIAYSNTIDGTASNAKCSDSGSSLSSKHDLLQRAKEMAKMKFKTQVAPHYVTVSVNLMKANGISSKDAEKKFDQGMDYATNSRMDRACELWNEAASLSPGSPSILYNVGVCAELRGEAEKAQEFYKKADSAIGEPNKDITTALNRITLELKYSEKLKSQMK